MRKKIYNKGLNVNSGNSYIYYTTLANSIYTAACVSGGSGGVQWIINSNKTKNMKIGKKQNFEIELQKVTTVVYNYDVLAETKEEALKMIEENKVDSHYKTEISIEITDISK